MHHHSDEEFLPHPTPFHRVYAKKRRLHYTYKSRFCGLHSYLMFASVCENLLKGDLQTMAYICQSWHPMVLNVWMRIPPNAFLRDVAKKRSSCFIFFKHLQMVMHQQLGSFQLSYCKGIKKTDQSLRSTAKLLCRFVKLFTEQEDEGKKGGGLSFISKICHRNLLQSPNTAWHAKTDT